VITTIAVHLESEAPKMIDLTTNPEHPNAVVEVGPLHLYVSAWGADAARHLGRALIKAANHCQPRAEGE
jgi:hypothetical protein